jgi:hypothetical protein
MLRSHFNDLIVELKGEGVIVVHPRPLCFDEQAHVFEIPGAFCGPCGQAGLVLCELLAQRTLFLFFRVSDQLRDCQSVEKRALLMGNER